MEAPYRRRITQSYLWRLRGWLEDLAEHPELLDDEAAFLPEDYAAVGAVHEMFMRSCLMGMDFAVTGKRRGGDFADPLLLPDMPVETLPFEEAAAFLQTQIPLTKQQYYALDDKLRLRAFTVGRLNDHDAVNRVKGIIRRNIESGGGITNFYTMTDEEILDGAGFGKGNMSYWETVYRTNEDTIHNAGRAMGFEASHPVALELVGVNDLRQTEICRTLTDPPFIRPWGDPVWKELWPPFHYSCRTYVRGIYDEAELEAMGGAAAYRQGNYAAPQKGFGAYPLDRESYWRLTPEMVKRAREYGIDGEIAAAAIKLGMKNYAIELVKDYKSVYTSASGGYVKQSALAKPGTATRHEKGQWVETDEMGLAERAADEGHEIFFLPRSKVQGVRNPDIIIDNHIADIKHVFTETPGAINGAIRGAKEQGASLVLMRAPDRLEWSVIEEAVRNRLGSQVKTTLVWWRDRLRRIE